LCPAVNVVFARGTGEPSGLGEVGAPFVRTLIAHLPGKTVTSYAVNYAADELQTSAGPGATNMSDHIISMAAQCPGTTFVIGGYSQGASVTDIAIGIPTILGTGTTIPAPLASRVAAVVVFGNPLQLTGETITSASRVYARKAEEFCDAGDPVCGNGGNVQAHLDYAANGSTTQGARFAAGQVNAAG
jgi:cutinase